MNSRPPNGPRVGQAPRLSRLGALAQPKPAAIPYALPNHERPTIQFRPCQQKAFCNRTNGIEACLWSRQTGEGRMLAGCAECRSQF